MITFYRYNTNILLWKEVTKSSILVLLSIIAIKYRSFENKNACT